MKLKTINISKKSIFMFLAAVWIIFSIIYIVWDRWGHFKNEQLTQAYNLGKTETINQAIKRAENEKCEPFLIYNDTKQVHVINTDCLKQSAENKSGDK